MKTKPSLLEASQALIEKIDKCWLHLFPEPPTRISDYRGPEELEISSWLWGHAFNEVDFNDLGCERGFFLIYTTAEAGAYYLASAARHVLNRCIHQPDWVAGDVITLTYLSAFSRDPNKAQPVTWLLSKSTEAVDLLYEVLDHLRLYGDDEQLGLTPRTCREIENIISDKHRSTPSSK